MTIYDGIICIVLLLAIGFGIGECFYGYKIFNFLLRLFGFCILGGLCFAIGLKANMWLGLVAGLAGGIVGVYLSMPLYCVWLFLLGALLGFGLSSAALALAGMNALWIMALPFALVGGIMALKLRRPMIIICTAISGAASVAGAVVLIVTAGMLGSEVLSNLDALEVTFFMKATAFAITCVLSLFGMAFQFHNTDEVAGLPQREDYRKNTVLG